MAMKKIVVKIVCILLLASCINSDYKSVSCSYPLRQLTMYDEKTGWGLSLENEVLFTEDGMEHFKPVRSLENAGNSSDRFASAAFIDQQTAYTAYFAFSDNQLIVERTKDSGRNWQQTFIDFENYSDICDAGNIFLNFADDQHGYLLCCSTPALGQMTKLLFSTNDGGETFSFTADLTDTIAGYPQGITVVSEEQIYIAVTYHGTDSYLYQTSDCAMTWESVGIFPKTEDVRYVDGYAPIFYGNDKQKGIILLKLMYEKAVYQLYTTRNAGDSWSLAREIPCDTPLHYSIAGDDRIYVIDPSGNASIFISK